MAREARGPAARPRRLVRCVVSSERLEQLEKLRASQPDNPLTLYMIVNELFKQEQWGVSSRRGREYLALRATGRRSIASWGTRSRVSTSGGGQGRLPRGRGGRRSHRHSEWRRNFVARPIRSEPRERGSAAFAGLTRSSRRSSILTFSGPRPDPLTAGICAFGCPRPRDRFPPAPREVRRGVRGRPRGDDPSRRAPVRGRRETG